MICGPSGSCYAFWGPCLQNGCCNVHLAPPAPVPQRSERCFLGLSNGEGPVVACTLQRGLRQGFSRREGVARAGEVGIPGAVGKEQ